MARLLLQAKSPEAIMDELGISESTYYRYLREDDFKQIQGQLDAPVRIPANHPDLVAAQDIAAKSKRSIAEKVDEGVRICLDELLARVGDIETFSNRDLIAATKLMLEEHRNRISIDDEDEDQPLTAEEAEQARKLLSA